MGKNRMIQFLLENQFKYLKTAKSNRGFTLIELLVAMIIAAIIITPLLGFMISVIRTDRQEQAKVSSEQELQTAIGFMSQELQQAVYVYDKDGLDAIKNEIPPAVSNSCNNSQTCTPVLVFWKRLFLDRKTELDKKGGGGKITVGEAIKTVQGKEGDTFVYSLVGYYLVEGGNDNPWSDVARITRFEIKDGIKGEDGEYLTEPSTGFASPPLDKKGDLKTKMNQWKKGTGNYTVGDVLIDYVEVNKSKAPQMAECDTTNTDPELKEQRIPDNKTNYNSFIACVNSKKNSVRVYIRGNALARVNLSTTNEYKDAWSSYFPVVSIQVKGRSFLLAK